MAVYRPRYRDRKTGELKQSAVWWYGFTFAGRRVQESANVTRKTLALEREKARRLELERAAAGLPSESPRERIRRVSDALKEHSAAYSVNHRKKSTSIVRERSAHLLRLLGSLLLPDLTPARIVAYMQTRAGEGASGRTINLEVQVLAAAIGQPRKALWPRVDRMEENRDAGRALEAAEETAILDAASKNRSKLIYPFLFVLAWTGLRSDEARLLTWEQVDFADGEIRVGDSKTEKGRGRRIPMSAKLKAVLQVYIAWYVERLGPLRPDWYVFPLCNRIAPVDPLKPVTSLKTAWKSVLTAAKVKCRLHDLRHSFCTKLGESGVPESTMLDLMGHVSAAMLRRYSHIRAHARREAIDAIESKQFPKADSKVSTKVADAGKAQVAVTN